MIDVDHVLARNLRAAIVSGQVEPFYQPIVSLDDGRIMGFEVLARWHRPGHGFVSPAQFIPIAEQIGLLDDLLEQLMRAAFCAAEKWPHNLFLSFNVSPTQLRDPELATKVAGAAIDWSFPLSRVHIEITETGLMDDLAKQRRTLDRLINLGCMVAMDDFGTGCSSLSWLNTLPFSTLKVDASFVMAMEEHRSSQKIVAAVVGLGHSLGLAVVAEGVETPGEAALLRGMGCQFAQGYLFGRPMPACAVTDLLLSSSVAVENDDCAVPISLALRAQRLSAGYAADSAVAFMDPTGMVVASSQAFDKIMNVAGDAVGQHIGDLIGVSTARLAELRATDLLDEMFPAFEETDAGGSVGNIHIRRVKDETCDLAGYSVEFDYATDPDYFQTSRSSTPLL